MTITTTISITLKSKSNNSRKSKAVKLQFLRSVILYAISGWKI